jgi:hypothetical protein
LRGLRSFLSFVGEKLGPHTYVNLMSQYRPEHPACQYPELSRRITGAEYRHAIEWAWQARLTNCRHSKTLGLPSAGVTRAARTPRLFERNHDI